MHTLPRPVILRVSAEVHRGWRFVNPSPQQRAGHSRLAQTRWSSPIERQGKLGSRVTLC